MIHDLEPLLFKIKDKTVQTVRYWLENTDYLKYLIICTYFKLFDANLYLFVITS